MNEVEKEMLRIMEESREALQGASFISDDADPVEKEVDRCTVTRNFAELNAGKEVAYKINGVKTSGILAGYICDLIIIKTKKGFWRRDDKSVCGDTFVIPTRKTDRFAYVNFIDIVQ